MNQDKFHDETLDELEKTTDKLLSILKTVS